MWGIYPKHINDMIEATGKLAKSISVFIRDNYDIFTQFDSVKVYYDNGQLEVNKILSSVFNVMLPEVEKSEENISSQSNNNVLYSHLSK